MGLIYNLAQSLSSQAERLILGSFSTKLRLVKKQQEILIAIRIL